MMSEPLVSVIIAVRNEAAFIARSLGAILAQDYPADRMEILLADGESDDDTVRIARSLPGGERVRILANPQRIQSAGLNLLIQEARGEYVVRVDGHTII
ncbi:MAG TPA: glycosyltransferase, partial [Ktedonobacterales bacterium]|nr:glycosyltransferase [Ktedonobacterales bacterium]